MLREHSSHHLLFIALQSKPPDSVLIVLNSLINLPCLPDEKG